MMKLSPILKMLGVNVPEEALKQIEVIIPQIPARLAEAVQTINGVIQRTDERLAAIEDRLTTMESQNRAFINLLAKENNGKRNRNIDSPGRSSNPGSN
jgi:hypothetical protein